jgi:hypothetical protein
VVLRFAETRGALLFFLATLLARSFPLQASRAPGQAKWCAVGSRCGGWCGVEVQATYL